MNNKIIYINDNEAMVSKKFEKNARVFGTPEFKLWREYLREFPNAKMITKSIKKNEKVTLTVEKAAIEEPVDPGTETVE